MSISTLTIDKGFAEPQEPGIKSRRLNATVDTSDGTVTIGQLKDSVRKKFPTLNDTSRITLIIPDGSGTILHDHLMASIIPFNCYILALISLNSQQTARLHSQNGVNLPSILFVYTITSLRTFINVSPPIPSCRSGAGSGFNFAANTSLYDLTTYFTDMGFNHDLVVKSLLHEAFLLRSPDDAYQQHQGYLAARITVRLCNTAGINNLTGGRDSDCTHDAFAIDVYSAVASSVASVSSTSTLQGRSHESLRNVLTSPPSVTMASPSEHESAYDGDFNQHWNTTTTDTLTGSQSGASDSTSYFSVQSGADRWSIDQRPDHQSVGPHTRTTQPSPTPSQLSDLMSIVNQVNKERDQSMGECARLQERKLSLTNQLNRLHGENSRLREECQAEAQTSQALIRSFEELKGLHHSTETEIRREVQNMREKLSGVVSCPICYETYGSLSSDADKRPIHLSCGHIFCATCLDTDWRSRFAAGNPEPYRCFNCCINVDPGRLGEIYLLEDIKEILHRLGSI